MKKAISIILMFSLVVLSGCETSTKSEVYTCGDIHLGYNGCDNEPLRSQLVGQMGCLEISCDESSSGKCTDCVCYRCFDRKWRVVDRQGNLIRLTK